MTRLWHFYHIFADGDWKRPLGLHLAALKESGLAECLDGFFYGLVGAEGRREQVKEILPGFVAAEADIGWEQVTLEALQEFAEIEDGKVLYAHTKGAWNNTDLSKVWRESMTYDTVVRWQECVNALDTHDVAGPFWLKSDQPEHKEHDFFFAGNFWWANLSYVRTLPELKNETRFQAEGWIGLNDPKAHVMRHGLSFWGNFAPPLPFEPIKIEVL